ETDQAETSEVEVRFTPAGEGRTRVELEHRNLDRHGSGWEGMRDAVGSRGGWPNGLERFGAYVAGQRCRSSPRPVRAAPSLASVRPDGPRAPRASGGPGAAGRRPVH